MLIRKEAHHELLDFIMEDYPAITRDEISALIHTLCEWVCPLCCAIDQSPKELGCTKCGDYDEP